MQPDRPSHHLTRRTLLAGAAGTVAVAGSVALAQQPPVAAPEGAPRVARHGPEELDDAYDQSKYAPNLAQIVQALRHQQRGGAWRGSDAPKRLSYGADSD